jgi:transposase
MDRKMLRDDHWERIERLCSGKASERGVTGRDNRLFVDAVLWIARTGSPWRDLPQHFAAWHTAYMRVSRWSKKGVWARTAEALTRDADLEQLFVDSTSVRVHQRATGAQKSRRSSHWT